MIFPLYDETRVKSRLPFVTITLIAINIIVYILFNFKSNFGTIVFNFGLKPGLIKDGKELYTFFTSMFLHADFFHLLGNMWFLWIFGGHLEDGISPLKFIILYIFAGIIANIVYIITSPDSSHLIPVIGASGAISAVLAGYIVLYFKNKIKVLMFLVYKCFFISVPSVLYVGFWFLLQILYLGDSSNIAYSSHIGGFIAGIFILFIVKKKISIPNNKEVFATKTYKSKKINNRKPEKNNKKINMKTSKTKIIINGREVE